MLNFFCDTIAILFMFKKQKSVFFFNTRLSNCRCKNTNNFHTDKIYFAILTFGTY